MAETILIAEDDPKSRKLLRDILAVKGYSVLEATNGSEAVELAVRNTPDLILLDLQMPVMDGLEAVKILKTNATTASIPVLALTSYAMPGDEQTIREAGCDFYITKPIDVPMFLECTERILARRHGALTQPT